MLCENRDAIIGICISASKSKALLSIAASDKDNSASLLLIMFPVGLLIAIAMRRLMGNIVCLVEALCLLVVDHEQLPSFV